MIGNLDCVTVTSTTGGTGAAQISAVVPGYIDPSTAGGVSGQKYTWRRESEDGLRWELFVGTLTVGSPVTISRDQVVKTHTGAASAINWEEGQTTYISSVPLSAFLPYLDERGLLNPAWTTVGLQSQLRSSTALSIANSTTSNFPWDTNDVNTLGLIPATPLGILTIQEDGVYRFQASLTFAPNVSGQRIMNLVVGGNTVRNQARGRGDANVATVLTVAWEAPVAAGTQARIDVVQDSGGALDVGGGTQSNFFITRLR
ncbi:hypothetical protein EBE87_20310 [Pseudoroseomonas wenyumeiae]|uniref:Uncharacterized protein n=1 Tax=Teichococcus wenyumeiae TaxID=2478470 RepID=A0A3A9JBY6_9PROT|nr:hypothetical protein [Pseudoroseomonas wenyumeiae]RKK04827.1 hypothetical protein D6Z83_07585 [Pseudoroseomonas wenyumeiae]RMI19495.1 hypothetical protein EBE87_20310 [Pseudoroseomonas wenyumeiae]